MLVHSVYFWLKQNLTGAQESEFRDGLESLRPIQSIEQIYIGTPSSTNRPVIERSYTYALTVIFKDIAAHDAYQDDPIHLDFVKKCSPFWEKVLIYDAD